jgi:filamentous hemagglutinin family protein
MGPKSGHISRHRGIIRATQARRAVNAAFALVLAGAMCTPVYAGRNVFGVGAPSGNRDAIRAQAFAESQAQAMRIQAAARDRLARSTAALQGMQAAQDAARASAAALNNVANGLRPGGLEVLAGAGARWDGADAPVAVGNDVTIKQNNQQAVLHWKTFNVGRDTTVNFDQSKGGADAGKWFAVNKVFDPSGVPSQIRGRINAQGQVYVINRNGVVFGGTSQINTRAFVASSLPINDNLVRDGLLNNKDAQFIFSGVRVPGGSDGTPAFEPPPLGPGEEYGDVIVERGARLQATAGQDGNGGRVMLVGANVRNEGTIETPAGQSILAAGLQVGVRAHPENDPSLRGLDVWVGQVGDYAGRVENSGLVRSSTGSIILAGKEVKQRGVLASTTSVNLNGRIDLLASYGAVGNPNFDRFAGSTQPPFLSQFTGSVELAPGSVTSILADANGKKLPGTRLAENSQVNIEGRSVYFGRGSILAAPSGDVTVRAGLWPFVDSDGDGTALGVGGGDQAGLSQHFTSGGQRFLLDGGQVYLDEGSIIDVSGSVNGFVPLNQHLLTVAMRSSELADSPVQRNSALRGVPLVVDLRETGVDNGRSWIGTPLGDLTGYLAIIERDIAQLTARGGTVSLSAGDSIVMGRGATIDVSGGLLTHGAGYVRTSMLSLGGRAIPVSSARADINYDGVYTGTATVTSKWRAPQSYSSGIFNPAKGYNQNSYFEGAPAGTASLNAPSLALAGNLVGKSYTSPDQRTAPPALGSLRLAFLGEKNAGSVIAPVFVNHSPFAPDFRLAAGRASSPALPEFELVNGEPVALPAALRGSFTLGSAIFGEDEGGFGNLEVENADGDFVVADGTAVRLRPGGNLAVRAKNVRMDGAIAAPGGSVALTAYNFSPYLYAELSATGALVAQPAPAVQPGRGSVVLGGKAGIDVSGMAVDDRPFAAGASFGAVLTDGGSISLEGYAVRLPAGSVLDAGGGIHAGFDGDFTFGDGGSIQILSGRDPDLDTSTGGSLVLSGALRAYSAATGGSLTLQSNFIHVGGQGAPEGGLDLAPAFFQSGGFSSYSLVGLGGRDALGENRSGILVAAAIEPRALSLARLPSDASSTPVSLRLGTDVFGPVLPDYDGDRQPVSLNFSATGFDDGFTEDKIEALGIVEMLAGSRIATGAGASVSLRGDVVKVDGSITAPGGTINIAGRGSFRLSPVESQNASAARPTVEIGPGARLSAAGTALALPDLNGLRAGKLFPGGSIAVSGNIVADQSAVLDVRGSSAELDFSLPRLGLAPTLSRNPFKVVLGLPVRVDSDGGRISLAGSQMLYSDAVLLGAAGGPSALGGSLAVSSGRFYASGADRSGADINLVVTQSGYSSAFQTGEGAAGTGYFAMDRFSAGDFANLDLGYFYLPDASPIPYGGNIDFRGDVAINATGQLRLAGGGMIKADGAVSLNASLITVGQPYQAPLNPADPYQPFRRFDGGTGSTPQLFVTPTSGTGVLNADASHIDAGNLVLGGIGSASLSAGGGDLRGYGSVNVAGHLTLQAARIYPTTLGNFDLFAYDNSVSGAAGSITVLPSGSSGVPLSAGGNLRFVASNIDQRGTLRAPLGSITLGWDGSGAAPANAVTGSAVTLPATANLALGASSVTSVSAGGLTIPFGLTPNGLSWIDPRGVDVTAGGLPQRSVALSAGSVVTASGSVVDVGGGGDLLAYRWVPGIGGTSDLLGAANQSWNSGADYDAGDLVSYGGATWSARVDIDPSDYAIVPKPEEGLFWVRVPESFAILPGLGDRVAALGSFNTGINSGSLGGDPGYVADGLRAGEQVHLAGIPGLASGYHTLLPRRYALLPGAFLVIPEEGELTGSGTVISTATPSLRRDDFLTPELVRLREGSYLTSGWSRNGLNPADAVHAVQTRFEVLPRVVVAARAQYDIYGANQFLAAAAQRLDLPAVQRLPQDSARLTIHGNTGLDLAGTVLARSTAVAGRAAEIDVSSLAAMTITGPGAAAPAPGTVVLSAGTLNAWGYGSLLVGGQRSETGDGVAVNVRSPQVVLDTPGGVLRGADITMAGKDGVNISPASALRAEGTIGGAAQNLQLGADGALVRVSTDASAATTRSGQPSATSQKVTVGSGASLAGEGVVVDSTYAADLDGSLDVRAGTLTLGSGQISVLLDGSNPALTGSAVAGHLVLGGGLLQRTSESDVLRLLSYRTIDFYGDGTFGSADLARLELLASGLRGYGAGGSGSVIQAGDVYLARPNAGMIDLTSPSASAGSLSVQSSRLLLGPGQLSVRGYDNIAATSTGGVLAVANGSLSLGGNTIFNTPALVGGQGVSYDINAAGALALQRAGSSVVAPGLGARMNLQGTSVNVASDILLPSGVLSVTATTGNIDVSGRLAAEGQARQFFDVTRYTDGGSIDLSARQGSVRLLAGSDVSVAAHADGGDAGYVTVRSPGGVFDIGGALDGSAGAGRTSGSFTLDAGSVADFDALRTDLDAAGFFQERNLRVRSGDVTVAGSTRVRDYALSADAGDITVTGTIDASGETGGRISLVTSRNLTLADGSVLTVAAEKFSNAGKGGHIVLESGSAINGVANTAALLDLQAGSRIDLSVAEYIPGSYTTPGSSAFYGRFEGALHLRAPRTADDVRIATIGSSIQGGSSILAEAYRVYQPSGGVMNRALRDSINTDNAAFITAGEAAITSRLLASAPGLNDKLVLAPGVEIINPNGDLTLGLANIAGSTNIEGLSDADWDLSNWRYGLRKAPGVLTLRAAGDLVFNNALSDGFTPISKGTAANYADRGHSLLWLGALQAISDTLPVNTQSWSYRLAAGADLFGADFRSNLDLEALDTTQPGKGSVLVGEFFASAVPNSATSGTGAGVGRDGQTADTIRINNAANNNDRGTRYEVIRTGTGSIEVAAGRDIQLRNPFATIYTSGVGLADPTAVIASGDFALPVTTPARHPDQGGVLGVAQQSYGPHYGLAGGNLKISAARDIGRFARLSSGTLVADTSMQLPSQWLYRRGLVDATTGVFASIASTGLGAFSDPSASTTWWVDYSNFFQGFGALGGGSVDMFAGRDLLNADAAIPTSARMAGQDAASGVSAATRQNLAPDDANLLEHGGGDLFVRAGRNLDGGNFYVERGEATLRALDEITTNEARSLTPWRLTSSQSLLDSSTWQAVTLFGGRTQFDVGARGDVLLGPATAAFLLPQGLNNKFWYKTQFQTIDPSAGLTAASTGGAVTHRLGVTLPGDTLALPALEAVYRQGSATSAGAAAYYRPWLRSVEVGTGNYRTIASVGLPSLRSTAFGGDVTVVGQLNLFPSPQGELELLASGAVPGMAISGATRTDADGSIVNVKAWTSARLNISDADASRMPNAISPLGFQQVTGTSSFLTLASSSLSPWSSVNPMFLESGSYKGLYSTTDVKSALHATTPVHSGNANPVRLYAAGGDLANLTLFAPKQIRAIASRDITDIAFYLQHTKSSDISLVSAGRNLIPFNESAPLRVAGGDLAAGNLIVDAALDTVVSGAGGVPVRSKALAGDIQIGGQGIMQVLAGRDIDFGSGANFVDGTGLGLTSIGRLRNPSLPFEGAHYIVMAGVGGISSGPALGLSGSSLTFSDLPASGFLGDTMEHKAVAAVRGLFDRLKQVGKDAAQTGNYDAGYDAVEAIFGKNPTSGTLFTRARDLRTTSGGSIIAAAPGGGITMASDIFGNPLTPPGIVTEYGGEVSLLTGGNIDIGRARIFTLRGGDLTIWSSRGDIAAGTAAKTVVTAPPTRVLIDAISAEIETDLGGLATGGGIGVLASVAGVEPGAVTLLAPRGTVDAGDAGIRATGNITIAAAQVRNADNIAAGGASVGVPASAPVAAPNVAGLSSASSSSAATSQAASDVTRQAQSGPASGQQEAPSNITVEVLGYGGGGEEEERQEASAGTSSDEQVL